MRTKKLISVWVVACALDFEVVSLKANTVFWSGAADAVSWNNPGNWSNNVPPTAADDAVISGVNTSTDIMLGSNVTVQSVQCSASLDLSAGGLALTQGASQVNGNLAVGLGESLSASGSGTSFVCPGQTTADDGNFSVSGGATISLPGLLNYNKSCNGANWTVTGANSVLSLPALTNMTGAACSYPVIQVTAGGQLQATSLVSITVPLLSLLVDGAGSLANLPALQTCTGNGDGVSFTAQNSGEIWIPQLTNAPSLAITITSGGTMSTAQLQQLDGITLSDASANFNNLNTLFGQSSIAGVAQSFPALTNFTDGNITVSGGAVVTFPHLQSYYKLCNGDNWTITDPNSVLSLPALTNLTGEACSYPVIQVLAGGQLQAPNLANLTQGPLTVPADGAGSLINFPALQVAAGEGQYILQMTAQNNGEIWIPLLTNAPTVAIDLNSGGTMPTAQFQQLDGITLSGASANFNNLNTLFGQSSFTGVTQSFPAVTNFTDANITVSGGAVVTFPDLQSYYKLCDGDNWTITDPGSVLSFPVLTNLTGEACSYPTIEVSAGGDLEATDLASITQGPLSLLADGTGSLIDFPALESGSGENGYPLQFTAQNNGTIEIPLLGAMNLVSITAQSAGLVSMNQVQGITGSFCNITSTDSGSVIDLSSLSAFATPLGASSLIATNDGQILLNSDNVFLLENVAVNWAGSANLPSAIIADNSLSLYAPAWLSYRVDVLDTRNPGNTWRFFTYVPQTNAVQQVSAQQPEPWQAFRVYTFMANPPLLEISPLGTQSADLVLYGTTDLTYRVESALKLSNATSWQPWSANIAMTNSFRIFAPIGSTNTEEFFRGRQL